MPLDFDLKVLMCHQGNHANVSSPCVSLRWSPSSMQQLLRCWLHTSSPVCGFGLEWLYRTAPKNLPRVATKNPGKPWAPLTTMSIYHLPKIVQEEGRQSWIMMALADQLDGGTQYITSLRYDTCWGAVWAKYNEHTVELTTKGYVVHAYTGDIIILEILSKIKWDLNGQIATLPQKIDPGNFWCGSWNSVCWILQT